MKQTFLIAIFLFALSGCVTMPTRSDPEAFKLIQSGQISQEDVPMFTDCVMDGFENSHYILTQFNVRQVRRATGYRVETCSGGTSHIVMSADIFNDGRVALYESRSAALINTQGERKVFSECLKKYEISK